ncbi:MAG: SPFH domain-containing protein [Treponema sp.]|jgi:membrane protease subunit (stomatin/prohibitin family)|nr:SPFH domain-containing protein [Treponema sp.]
MLFFKKKMITFGGDSDDLVWLYDASNDRNLILVASVPNEVVHVKDGAIAASYTSQKIAHKYSMNSSDKYYFVNVKKPCQTNWGTSRRLEYKDADSGRIVSIGANGVISFQILNSVLFLEKVLGNRGKYTSQNLTEEMLPKVFIEFYDHLLSVIQDGNLTYSQLDSKLKEISSQLVPKIDSGLKKYGVCIEEFIIMQFVKPEELKDRANELAAEAEKHNNAMRDADRKIDVMKKQEEVEAQGMKMDINKAEHQVTLAKMEAGLKSDIEKMEYDAKGVSYKELREMDREDIMTKAEAEATVERAKKIPEDTVVIIKRENKGKCAHCDGEITERDIFCPTCKKKVI